MVKRGRLLLMVVSLALVAISTGKETGKNERCAGKYKRIHR